ncbi:molybdopterin molybdotransferase MoeA [Paracoccaceae bacterium]|nr:molybdopterin molybdotransferase MoeA [Paracoccaceae bacterium]
MNVFSALNVLSKYNFSFATENIFLKDSIGRTLSKPLTVSKSIPEFDTSSMDGFAIKKSSLGKIKRFRIIGEIPAGSKSRYVIKPYDCVRVYTGSRMPKNADFVVIQENTTIEDDFMHVVTVDKKSPYVRKKGLDFNKGQVINHPMIIDFKLISALASLNLEKVSVIKKPKVCIIPTGNEVLALGSKPRKNSIYSSSPYGIKSLLEGEGAEITIAPVCRDNLADISCALENTKQSQVIITLGGVSKGNYDLVRKHYSKLGIKILVDGITIRPGKPIIIGQLGKKIIFCLPGNPISSIVCTRLFIVTLIRKMLGGKHNKLHTRKALLSEDIKLSKSQREHYMRAFSFQKGTTLYVKPFTQQDSSLHSVLIKSNCLLIIPPFSSPQKKGEIAEIIDF